MRLKLSTSIPYMMLFMLMLFITKIYIENEKTEQMENHNQIQSPVIETVKNKIQLSNKDSQVNKISMAEYMRFFKRNWEQHYSCDNVTRPDLEDIIWRKDTYQYVRLKFEDHPENDVFGMKFYFDDRFIVETGERHIRGIVSVKGPGPLINKEESMDTLKWAWAMNRQPWRVLLWNKGFSNPIGVKCKIQGAAGLNRNVSNSYYFQQVVTCPLPDIGALMPEGASIVRYPCGKPTNYMEVVYPEQSWNPHSDRKIGVCMASLFGNMGRENVTYFVNWMETLHRLGATEVTINNSTLTFTDEVMRKAFQYYQDIGWLTFTHYPPLVNSWISPEEDLAAADTVNKITTGDCIYRNMKRYWYVLIIDMDEIPVPVRFDTYQDLLTDYTSRQTNLSLAHCLAVRSAYFYQDLVPPGNLEHGSHLPVLRHTNSFGLEPIEVEPKSFHNTRNMVAAGHHLTRQTHSGGGPKHLFHHYMDPEEILLHHYRSDCKYNDFCQSHWNATVHDDIVPRKYGPELKDRVEEVLHSIGYSY